MIVPNKYAISDTIYRIDQEFKNIRQKQMEEETILTFIEISSDNYIKFTNGGSITILSEQYKNKFRGLGFDIIYVHPWTKQYHIPDQTISTCLRKGGVIF